VSYTVQIKRSAEKAIASLPNAVRRRIDQHILALAVNPRPQGAIRLQGVSGVWRLRVGDYRIIYDIRDRELVVLVIHVAHRREAYRGL
jgi:mRNA interferase RelE/StbE